MKWLLIFLFPFLTQAQDITLVSSNELKADTFVGVDTYEALYYIKDNVIYKEAPFGNFNFNDLQLGTITSIDIINPLKVIVFYANFNTVVFLDNKLNEIERIDFNEIRGFNTAAVTNAGNNRLWLFDNDVQQLYLYNFNTDQIVEIGQPFDSEFINITSDFNYCHILTNTTLNTYSTKGGLIYNETDANYEKIIQHDENIVALFENQLLYKPEKETLFNKLKTPQINIQDFYLTQDFLYIYDRKTLNTFELKQFKN